MARHNDVEVAAVLTIIPGYPLMNFVASTIGLVEKSAPRLCCCDHHVVLAVEWLLSDFRDPANNTVVLPARSYCVSSLIWSQFMGMQFGKAKTVQRRMAPR
jgi:hypothetical protein